MGVRTSQNARWPECSEGCRMQWGVAEMGVKGHQEPENRGSWHHNKEFDFLLKNIGCHLEKGLTQWDSVTMICSWERWWLDQGEKWRGGWRDRIRSRIDPTGREHELWWCLWFLGKRRIGMKSVVPAWASASQMVFYSEMELKAEECSWMGNWEKIV